MVRLRFFCYLDTSWGCLGEEEHHLRDVSVRLVGGHASRVFSQFMIDVGGPSSRWLLPSLGGGWGCEKKTEETMASKQRSQASASVPASASVSDRVITPCKPNEPFSQVAFGHMFHHSNRN